MENIALYIAKASALTAVFFGAYYLLLRKETFFRANRWFLLAGMATSVLLPVAVFTKIVWVKPQPVSAVNVMSIQDIVATHSLQAPQAQATFEFEWWMAALALYGLVTVFLLTRLAIDFRRVLSLFRGQAATRLGRYKIIDSKAAKSPFSFFNYIVYNSDTLDPAELQGIISHEKVHSSQRHSIDMLLAQLFCTAFWFNPFAWLYKKAIAQNLEFIADAEAVKHVTDVTAYQKTLLKMTLDLQNSNIASHFYQPLIKKRIMMINKPKSKKRNSFKYAAILPLLALFVGFFQVKTEAREKAPDVLAIPFSQNDSLKIQSFKYTLTPYTKDDKIKETMGIISQIYDINASCDAGRNDAGDIVSVTVTLTGNGLDKVYEEKGRTPIKNLTIEVSRDADGKISADFTNPVAIEAGGGTIPLKANNITVSAVNSAELDEVLVVVDGIKQGKNDDWTKIDPNNIAAVNIYRNEKETVEKYGKEAENGVIEITTKKSNPANKQIFTSTIIQQNGDGTNQAIADSYRDLRNGSKPDYRKAHVLYNNKEISPAEFEDINPEDIATLLFIPEGNESTINTFGPKAANGVIMVTGKKTTRWSVQGGIQYTDNDNNGKPEMLLIENSGLIITKRTTDAQIQSYVEILARSGITMKYRGVKRNADGYITNITIELSKGGNKTKGEIESSTGIKDIYVGEKEGRLTAAPVK
jgi:beta-lactamase regulating signal transducer with metallopeptidase domain